MIEGMTMEKNKDFDPYPQDMNILSKLEEASKIYQAYFQICTTARLAEASAVEEQLQHDYQAPLTLTIRQGE